MSTPATAVFSVATRLRDDVKQALRAESEQVNQAVIYPAAIPWDACDCGTLAIAVQRQYITSTFPAIDDASQLPCNGGFVAADIVIQVLRCAPTPQGRSTTPTANALELTAKLIQTDAWLVLRTVQCTLAALRNEEDVIIEYAIRPQIFAPPSGGCVGSILSVTVAVDQVIDA